METAFLQFLFGNAEKGTDDKGYMRNGKKNLLPCEDLVISTLVRKPRVTQRHLCHPGGQGWAREWEKLRERKNNYSGTEKDAVVTMTHQTGGQFQLFFSSTKKGRKKGGCILTQNPELSFRMVHCKRLICPKLIFRTVRYKRLICPKLIFLAV